MSDKEEKHKGVNMLPQHSILANLHKNKTDCFDTN